MLGWLYLLLLMSTVAFVAIGGGLEERVLIAALSLAGLITGWLYKHGDQSFDAISLPLLVNEAALLIVTLVIAYRSHRFWPLPFAAFEIAAFLPLITPLFGRNLVSYALGVAQGLWAYPQLLLLVLATIRGRNRDRRMDRRSIS